MPTIEEVIDDINDLKCLAISLDYDVSRLEYDDMEEYNFNRNHLLVIADIVYSVFPELKEALPKLFRFYNLWM